MSLSLAVIEAVAAAEGVDPTDLRPTLAAVVDPDALDTIFRDSTGTVTFTYHGYEVTVDHSGEVDVAHVEKS